MIELAVTYETLADIGIVAALMVLTSFVAATAVDRSGEPPPLRPAALVALALCGVAAFLAMLPDLAGP